VKKAEESRNSCLKSQPLTPSISAASVGVCPGVDGHKLKHRMFHLNMRKNFFPLRVTEHWNRLPREVVESPSLEIFKTCLDKVLCSLV